MIRITSLNANISFTQFGQFYQKNKHKQVSGAGDLV